MASRSRPSTPNGKASLEGRLRKELRTNRYNDDDGILVISDTRAEVINGVADHYRGLFGGDPALRKLREDYALQDKAIKDPERLDRLANFFFWTSWACVTERPGETFSYTNNWPHDPLVGNHPTAANVFWSVLSIVLLLAAIGGFVWWYAARGSQDEPLETPSRDPPGQGSAHTIDARRHQIRRRRHRPVRRPSSFGRTHGALHGRR